MKKNNKGFAPIMIILVVLVIAGTAYYFGTLKTKTASVSPTSTPAVSQTTSNPTAKPTTDPTANWKTYTNQQYSFSFKYPPSWQFNDYSGEKVVSGDQPQLVTSVFNKTSSEAVTLADKARVEFSFAYFKPSINPQKFINGLVANDQLQSAEKSNNKYIKKYSDRTANVAFTINPLTNEVVEMTTTVLNETTVPQWADYFDQILSTFKFTK